MFRINVASPTNPLDPQVVAEHMSVSSENLSYSELNAFLAQPDDQFYAKTQWMKTMLSEAEKELDYLRARRKKKRVEKYQELYSLQPKKAFSMFKVNVASPTNPLDPQVVADHMREKYNDANSFINPDDDDHVFKIDAISEEARKTIKQFITSQEIFKNIIETRPKASANGPDAINYNIFGLCNEAAAKWMNFVSIFIHKFQKMPTK